MVWLDRFRVGMPIRQIMPRDEAYGSGVTEK
jgi:hypothetical protein